MVTKQFWSFILVLVCLAGSVPVSAQNADIARLLERTKDQINAGNADDAIPEADSVVALAIKDNDSKSRVNAMRLKGKALFALKKNKEAVDLYFDALRLCKSPGDDREISMLYREIGYTYYSQGHSREAKEYYKKEIAIRRALYGNDSAGEQLINLAVMYDQLKQRDSAFILLKEVNEILSRNDDRRLRGYYYLNLGALLESGGKLDSAEECYHKAYKIWHELGDENQLFKATFNLGYIEEEKKNYREAIRFYLLSEASAKKFGFQTEIAHVYGTMAEAYESLGDYKNAYKYLYKYAILNDSLSKGEFNSYVVRLDKQFHTEKNRQTIQEQQMRLKDANIEVQKQRNRALIIIILFIVVVLAGVIVFGYVTFKGRVRKHVEEAKGKFFANVVHEIRTPLSMIQAPIKVLQTKVSDPTLHYQLDIAERNTNRLNELVNQMLDISKIDAAKYRIKESVGNLHDFLEEVIEQYRSPAQEKKINFVKQIEINAGNVIFDKDAVEKILANLLSNAVKYTPAGGTVGIEASAVNQRTGVDLTINVWDTGSGINKEEQPKIFSRFFRAKEQEDAGTKGMGIGLSLVNDLVSLMQGSIEVESEPGKGAVFTVRLLLKPVMPAIPATENTNTGDSTILLVEDDWDILDFNKTLLIDKGYNVVTATNGIEAASAIQEQLPDLVITDLMMPGKDGLDLLKEMKGNPLTGHIPVIILSAKTSSQSKMEGMTEGAQVYLSKPFQPEELVALVRNQLLIIEKQRAYYQQQTIIPDKGIEERFAGSDPFTRKCFSIIQEHLDDAQLSVEKLADLMSINRSHFQRKIKALTGYSPSQLIRTIRLEKAKEMLQKKEGNITEIAYATGFTAQSYFTKCYSDHFGYPPSQEQAR